ncbi:AT-rich interactive domain-containing protein 2 [Phtheirospermum japonicum]|uniref:AT-rich interactive domain-containing protein 2 n=1 Tax=Phtheirospermum japonicum TaxID=374723 RepID=A0A830BJ83_9LAMI|nr:AT-rich interactive domain-containing protein 2 [Phtheirospermum japonicum]
MTRQSGVKGMKNASTTSHINGVVNVQPNSIFGKFSEAEIISQLKALAVDPCRPRDNTQALWNQILKLRKVMVLKDSEAPWRKRKLEKFVKDGLKPPSVFVCPNEPSIKKLSRKQSSHVSSLSCLVNSADSTHCQDEKITFNSRASSSLLTFDDTAFYNCLRKDIPPTVDSDESVKGSNQLSPDSNPNSQTPDGAHSRLHEPSPRRSIRLLNFIGDHLQRKVIPVGPRFQADVHEWAGPEKNDPDNSKWLGTRVWPVQTGNTKSIGKKIGKGRPDSCCCAYSGSADCIRRHVLQERLVVKSDLGPAFFSWKFDEMGDQVLKTWSLKEKQSFESVVKMRPSSDGKSFLRRALKCFPAKNGSDVVNYYFNVYIPHRMSLCTRSHSVKQVDTDDDETEVSRSSSLSLTKILFPYLNPLVVFTGIVWHGIIHRVSMFSCLFISDVVTLVVVSDEIACARFCLLVSKC